MIDQTQPILCRLAADLPNLEALGPEIPTEIQWMPPGKHTITTMRGGKRETNTVVVDSLGAERMSVLLADLNAKAAASQGDVPYFDFNHLDSEASGRPMGFRWAGDDPVTGGIRVAVDWTAPGKAALSGKAFRRFSPSFFLDAEGRVLTSGLNMGGLVNRAAFTNIAPIVSKDGGGSQTEPTMTPEELAAHQAALLVRDAEIKDLNCQISNLKSEIVSNAKVAAKAIVDDAIKAGKLPTQATELHNKWITAIATTPALAETLYALAPNAALGTIIAAGSAAGGAADKKEEKLATAAEVWNRSK